MSYVTLQFGQCGNQIGQQLYSLIYDDINMDLKRASVSKNKNSDYVQEATSRWFYVNAKGEMVARSILVDTEEKVTGIANVNKPYKFRSVVAKSCGGSANNWACGYNMKSGLLINSVCEAVRKQTESCDSISSFINLLSSGGGTGSGVGSKVVETLREQYPSKTFLNVITLPYHKGEVVTQNYNTILTLNSLYDITDASFLFENDCVHSVCAKLSPSNVKMSDVNDIISQQLGSILQPCSDLSLENLIMNLAPHPNYKFIQVCSAPHISVEALKYETSSSWSELAFQIKRSLRSRIVSNSKKTLKCLSSVIISRGETKPDTKDFQVLTDNRMYVDWLPEKERRFFYHQNRAFREHKFLTTLSNNNTIGLCLDGIVNDGWTLFTSAAFLHHYKKYGVDEEQFFSAFLKIEEIVKNYSSL